MIKTIDRIQYSKETPSNTNILWDDGVSLKIFRNGEWNNIGTYVPTPDWFNNDKTSTSYIKNKTHGIEGVLTNISIKECTPGTVIFDRLFVVPIYIGNTIIDSYGEHTITVDGKEIKLLIEYKEPIKYIGNAIMDIDLDIISTLNVKKLDSLYLPIATDEEVLTIINDIFDEQVN